MTASSIPLDLANDPLRFVSMCWPHMRLAEKQRDVLLSIRDHPETFVHAANQTGKTRIAAVAALWFFATRTPARVVASSSSETQLSSILWSEIQELVCSSKLPLPFVVKSLQIKKWRDPHGGETETLDYVIGYVTNQVENFQGHHLPGEKPRVLAIFDEASGVPDEFYDAADSWAHRKLVVGNPLSNHGFFYRLSKAGDQPDPVGGPRLLRKVIRIDGRDSPNVRLGLRWQQAGRAGKPPVLIPGLLTYEEFLRRQRRWDPVKRTIRLYGHFYEGNETMIFPADWLDAAMDPQRWAELNRQIRRAEAMGVDVAAGGRDKTCWTLVDEHGVIAQIVLDTPETMQIAGRTIELMRRYGLSAHRVALDAGGGGKPIADRLREQGHHVQLVAFGEAAEVKQAYKNRRAELYGELRGLFDPAREEGVFALPPKAHELRQELAVLPLAYDSEGRLFLPPKERRPGSAPGEVCLRSLLGGRSPDRADSLALAAWALEGSKRYLECSDHDLVCEDDSELTPEEIAAMPDELREIWELEDQLAREYGDRRWDDLWD